jgi:spore protease
MHTINCNYNNLHTDLILEQDLPSNINKKVTKYKDITVTKTSYNKNNYTTISFSDITDKDNFLSVQKVFVKELKRYLDLKENDTILVIGLGNEKSTPDSLGPKVIDNILVTRYLYLFGDVSKTYSNVSAFKPDVMGNTGIETRDIIKSLINNIKADKVIVIDALKASHINRLVKTIQITDSGISPGSGINNNRLELNSNTLNTKLIAIGVPTVVDAKTILESLLNKEVSLKENLMVTPTSIDFQIEKLSLLLGKGINLSLHKNYIRQNNN